MHEATHIMKGIVRSRNDSVPAAQVIHWRQRRMVLSIFGEVKDFKFTLKKIRLGRLSLRIYIIN